MCVSKCGIHIWPDQIKKKFHRRMNQLSSADSCFHLVKLVIFFSEFVSPNRGSPCVDSSCRFSQFVNPPVTRTENPVSSSTNANVVQNTSVPKASNTAPVFSSNAAPVFVSTPSRSVQNNPEPVRSQGTSQSSRVKSSFPRTQPARSLDGK